SGADQDLESDGRTSGWDMRQRSQLWHSLVVESRLREPVAQQSFVPVQQDSSSEDC
ncbi:unnamed protein product, partial [Pylaiella littoralis]